MPEIAVHVKASSDASKVFKQTEDDFHRVGSAAKASANKIEDNTEAVEKNTKEQKENKESIFGSLLSMELLNKGLELGTKAFEFMTASSGEFQYSIKDLSGVGMGFAGVIGSQLAGSLSTAANKMTSFLKSAEGINLISRIGGNIAAVFSTVGSIASAMGDSFKRSIKPISDAIDKLNDSTKSASGTSGAFTVLQSAVVAGGVGFNVLSGIIGLIITNIGNMINVVKAAGTLMKDFFSGKWDKLGEDAKSAIDAYTKSVADFVTGVGSIVDNAVKEGDRLINDSRIQADKLADNWSKTADKVTNDLKEKLGNATFGVVNLDALEAEYQKYLKNKSVLEQESLSDFKEYNRALEETNKQMLDENFNNYLAYKQAELDAQKAADEKAKQEQEKSDNEKKELKKTWANTVVQMVQNTISTTQSIMQNIMTGVSDYFATQIQNMQTSFDKWMEHQEEARADQLSKVEYDGLTELEYLQKKVDTAKTKEEKAQAEKELKKYQINASYNEKEKEGTRQLAKKKYEMEKQQFEIKKGTDTANVVMSAAAGIVGAWASAAQWPGPSMVAGMALAGVLTGLIGILTGVQIGVIQSKQFPAASFEYGGILEGNSYTGDKLTFKGNAGEMYLSRDQQLNLFKMINQGTNALGNTIIQLLVDSKKFYEWIFDGKRLKEARSF